MYKRKLWTNHERKSAQARAFQQNEEYILPIKIDDTEIPGIRPTTGYVDFRQYSTSEICSIILEKLGFQDSETQDNKYSDDDFVLPSVKRNISDLEKKKYLKSSFEEISNYFQTALEKLCHSNQRIETEFENITSSKFVASVYLDEELKAQCKIWIGGMFGGNNSISFAEGIRNIDINNDNSLNDSATIEDDGKEIFFNLLSMSFGRIEGIEDINLKHCSAKEVAKYYWGRFINYLRY